MPKKKVLFFLFGGCGGAERMTINIGKMLHRNRYDVKFVICGTLDKIYDFIPTEYEVIRIPWHNIYVFPRLRIGRVLLKEKPDFVFASSSALNILLLQIARLLKIKCIVRQDNMLRWYSKGMQRNIQRWYKTAYRVIAQQEEMQQELIDWVGTDEKQVVCLHNPVDTKLIDSFKNEGNPYPQDDSINYLWVGNYLPTKGHDILAEAFKIVHERNPKTHLYLVGNTKDSLPNYIKTKAIVREAHLENYVHFVGQQANPYKWMTHCDCFVLPSRIEGLPNVLLEAMCLQRPVVASVCIPVIDRMVEEEYNGYKVKPESPVEMAEAMEKALQLQDFKMTFQLATQDDFIKLFE